MKRVPFIAFFICITSFCYAQPKVKTKEIGGTKFIVPTIELMDYYLRQSVKDWEKEMINSNFFSLTGDSFPEKPVYQKGKTGNALLAACKSSLGIITFDWYNYIDKESVLTEIIAFIKPYYKNTQGNILYYVYKDWIVGVEQNYGDGIYFERVSLLRKDNKYLPK